MKSNSNSFPVIDILKLIFAFCVIGIHSWFLYDTRFGYYTYTMIYRLAVPFFFLASGYFLARNVNSGNRNIVIKDFLKKTLNVYLLLSSLCIFINMVKGNNFTLYNILKNIWQVLIGNCWGISWFLGALLFSGIVIYFLKEKKYVKTAMIISVILYIIGLLFNTYNFVLINHNFDSLYTFLAETFGNNSNFIFVGFMFFSIGYYLALYGYEKISKSKTIYYLLIFLGFIILFFEVSIVKNHLDVVQFYEYYFAHLLIVPSLFILAIKSRLNKLIKFDTKYIRSISTYLFYFHAFVLELLLLYRNYNSISILNSNIGFYLSILLISIIISLLFMFMKKKASDNYNTKVLSFGLYFISFAILFFSIMTLLNDVIWVDEACTLSMIKHSFIDIIKLNINDVHPPLYYLSIKVFVDIVHIFIPLANTITLAKIFSIIPLFILIWYGITKIRKDHGILSASLFVLFIISMPQLMQYFVEIRMYSWALCFTTIAFIYLYDIIKNNSNKFWILFTLFSILSAYSHLYSCLCIVIMFIFLFFYLLYKKDKDSLKKWWLFGIITFILYLPWTLVIILQLKGVSGGFWIPPITFDDIVSYIKFIFVAETNDYESKVVLFGSIILILIFLIIKLSKRQTNDNIGKSYYFLGLLMPFIVIIIGVVASICITPLFISRYMVPSLGVMWLVIAILINDFVGTKINYKYIILPFVIIALANINFLIRYEIGLQNNMDLFMEVQSQIEDNSIIVSDYQHVQLILSYYHPDKKIYCYKCYNSEMINNLFGNVSDNIVPADIKRFLNIGKKVYFFRTAFDVDYSSELAEFGMNIIEGPEVYEDWYKMQFYTLYIK